jgi:hypothetical protein
MREHHVLRFHAAVHQSGCMRISQSRTEGTGDLCDLRRGKRSVVQSLSQRRPADQFENQVQANALVVTHVVQGDDHWVRQRRCGAHLFAQSLFPLVVLRSGQPEIVSQHLEGNLASEDWIARKKHSPAAALAEEELDLVSADARRDLHDERCSMVIGEPI